MTLLKDKIDKDSKTPVLDLLKDIKNWCQGSMYRNENGVPTKPTEATCCCLVGALDMCYPLIQDSDVFHKVLSLTKAKAIGAFNDSSTHQEIVELLKKAQV